jgi:hypothetical protein
MDWAITDTLAQWREEKLGYLSFKARNGWYTKLATAMFMRSDQSSASFVIPPGKLDYDQRAIISDFRPSSMIKILPAHFHHYLNSNNLIMAYTHPRMMFRNANITAIDLITAAVVTPDNTVHYVPNSYFDFDTVKRIWGTLTIRLCVLCDCYANSSFVCDECEDQFIQRTLQMLIHKRAIMRNKNLYNPELLITNKIEIE